MKILMRADTHVSFSVPAQEPKAKCTFTQVLAALSISLGSMVIGFASAYTSTALPTMKNVTITKFIVTENQASWVTSLMPLGALIGGIIGGTLIECLGRRNTLLATALPFSLSWILIGFAKHVVMIFAARFICGFCVGIASLSLPVYLSETVQPEVRGILGLLPTAFGNIGILICYIVGSWVNWTTLAFIGATLPIPFLVLTFLIPETPRWYISRGHKERARYALKWLRGKKVNIEPELESINNAHIESEKSATTNILKELILIKHLKPLMISLGLMFFQQLSGINAVISYTVEIFEQSGSSIDKNTSTIIVGVVNFFATFVATTVIDRFGRKILLYVSNVIMIITLLLLSGYFFAKYYECNTTSFDWLPLGSAIIYVIGFSLGFGPIPWLMMGEILPSKVRGSAASISTSFNWACTFIVTKTYLDLNGFIGNHGVFLLFGIIEVFGLIFIIYCVPETQGRTLEDIENKMTGRTEVRRMSSIANMKPLAFNM